jgi:hypothetical protein
VAIDSVDGIEGEMNDVIIQNLTSSELNPALPRSKQCAQS